MVFSYLTIGPVMLFLIKWWTSLYISTLDRLYDEMLELISVFCNNGKDNIALGLLFSKYGIKSMQISPFYLP